MPHQSLTKPSEGLSRAEQGKGRGINLTGPCQAPSECSFKGKLLAVEFSAVVSSEGSQKLHVLGQSHAAKAGLEVGLGEHGASAAEFGAFRGSWLPPPPPPAQHAAIVCIHSQRFCRSNEPPGDKRQRGAGRGAEQGKFPELLFTSGPQSARHTGVGGEGWGALLQTEGSFGRGSKPCEGIPR